MKTHILRFLRDLLGLFAGSIVAAVLFLTIDALFDIPAGKFDGGFTLTAVIPGTVIIFAFAAVWGLPAHALLYRLKWTPIYAYALAAALEAFVYNLFSSGRFSPSGLTTLAAAMPAAAACTAIAWLIRRPDKDDKPRFKPENTF